MWQVVVNVIISLSFLLIFTGHFSMEDVRGVFRFFVRSLDINLTTHTIYTVINMIMESFHRPLLFFACIAIGQQWKEHRIIGAILAYMGISIASQIINTIAIVATGFGQLLDDYPVNGYLIYTFIFGLVTTVGFFLITDYLLSKKLNLE